MTRPSWISSLYVQVLAGIALGVLVGAVSPESGAAMKPLGDGFIKLIKMLIGPIVFTTIAVGIARIGALTDVGRIGLRALIYFEVVSTLALVIGLVVVNLLQPGTGLQGTASGVPPPAVPAGDPSAGGAVDFVLGVIPDTVVGALARGDILQILVIAILVGVALLLLGERTSALVTLIDQVSQVFFVIVGMVMRLAPIGAFGAMAFTIGEYGLGSLLSLGKLMAGVYITSALFVAFVLGTILRACGLGLWRFLRYIREELLIVLGTSSSESVLPRIMQKLEHLGCAKPVVGLVIPTGYSFNLDGTAIYMSMAAVFVAQAGGIHLTLAEQLSMLSILLLTSKGAAGVVGSGFVTLVATIAVIPAIPPAGLALLVGVDRFMAEARALTNLIGNAVATIAIAKWDGALDVSRARAVLADDHATTGVEPAARQRGLERAASE